jgi:hypothetical protein
MFFQTTGNLQKTMQLSKAPQCEIKGSNIIAFFVQFLEYMVKLYFTQIASGLGNCETYHLMD